MYVRVYVCMCMHASLSPGDVGRITCLSSMLQVYIYTFLYSTPAEVLVTTLVPHFASPLILQAAPETL